MLMGGSGERMGMQVAGRVTCVASCGCEMPSYTVASAVVWLEYKGQRVWGGREEGTHGT